MAIHFVHIGDLHAAPGPRNADRFAALEQIIIAGCALAERKELGAWLWPGDLFDALSSTEDRNALDERLRLMASHAPVVICYGNHDRKGDLDGFANLAAEHPILVVDSPRCVRVALAGEGANDCATIFVLPYPHKGGLIAAGVAGSDVVTTAADVLEPIFMVAAAELEDARAAGDITLMIGHINVAGSIVSTGQPQIGKEIELNPRHLDQLGAVYKGLNHVHKPQQIAGAWYAGSVARQTYGEVEDKRFLIVRYEDHYDDLNPEPAPWPFAVESRPIDIAPMFLIEGRLTREGFQFEHDDFLCPWCHGDGDSTTAPEGVCHLCGGDGKRRWTGADVRVQYTYRASELPILDPAVIADHFVGALRLKVESFAEPDRELRNPAVAAETTLMGKLAAYATRDLTDGERSKLDLLEHQDEAIVLGFVATVLTQLEFPASAETATVAA